MRPTSVFWYLLIVGGYLVICVRGKKICGPNEYPITGYHSDCIPCDKCHEGYGLVPKCGTPIKYQVDKTDCKPCGPGTFNDKYDSSSCNICHNCVDHELITKQCTNKSDTVCSGTCEKGYFFSKKDGTHSCQKCSFCCFDGNDEEVPDCKKQGFSATKQHCSPRPDKDCSPATPSTGHVMRTEVTTHSPMLSQTKVILIGVFSTATVMALIVVMVVIYMRKRKARKTTTAAHAYAAEGPTVHSVHFNRASPEAVNLSEDGRGGGPSAQQNAVGDSSSGLNQNATNDSGHVSVCVNTDDGGNLRDAAIAEKVAGDASVVKSTSHGKDIFTRQTSRDSQSGDGANAGRHRRSSSTSSFTESLKRKLSAKREDSLVHNEEEDMDGAHGPIIILQEPSSQEKKEGSKVEFVFKCKARDVNRKLIYQWFKDGEKLLNNEATLRLKSVTLPDFGCYKCCASCKDNPSDFVESSLVELDVTPCDGTRYKYLSEVQREDFNTQKRVENLLTQKRHSLGGWREVAFKYGMDQLDIIGLEDDPNPGSKTLGYLDGSNPDLTVYDFCKTLKEYRIRRLDIVKELLNHLSVACSSSSKVYV